MMGGRRASGLALALSVVLTTAAWAGSIEDGNAGLAALNRGAYDEAIRLFTRALKAGDLSSDDQEFAYLNRGKAYLARGDERLALSDLHKAAELKPDDPDVKSELAAASRHSAKSASASAASAVITPDATASSSSCWLYMGVSSRNRRDDRATVL